MDAWKTLTTCTSTTAHYLARRISNGDSSSSEIRFLLRDVWTNWHHWFGLRDDRNQGSLNLIKVMQIEWTKSKPIFSSFIQKKNAAGNIRYHDSAQSSLYLWSGGFQFQNVVHVIVSLVFAFSAVGRIRAHEPLAVQANGDRVSFSLFLRAIICVVIFFLN